MANYQAILDAIDAAVLAGVSGPGRITGADGRTIEYRSLSDLLAARSRYARLQSLRGGLRVVGIRPGGAR